MIIKSISMVGVNDVSKYCTNLAGRKPTTAELETIVASVDTQLIQISFNKRLELQFEVDTHNADAALPTRITAITGTLDALNADILSIMGL